MADLSLSAVSELDLDFFEAIGVGNGAIAISNLGAGSGNDGFGGFGFAVPVGIVKVFVGADEVVNCKVVFAVKSARSSTDNLFELDNRVDGTQEDDIADIAGINSR